MSKKKDEEKDYSWLREPDVEFVQPIIQFVEEDFAKVQAERDALKLKVLELSTEVERLSRELARTQ